MTAHRFHIRLIQGKKRAEGIVSMGTPAGRTPPAARLTAW
jgi:hypothetical protein